MADFPTSLTSAVDTVTPILAKHLNNLETKVGTDSSAVATSIDYLLKNSSSIDPGHKHTGANINYDRLGSSTYYTGQEYLNIVQSSGRISGGDITATAPADGTVVVSALKGFIKTSDSEIGGVKFFDLAQQTAVALTDQSINYLYVDYNAGTPRLLVTTNRASIRLTDQFTLGRCFREGTAVEVLQSGTNAYNRTRRVHERWVDTFGGVSRALGAVVSNPSLLKIALTAGVFYTGSNKFTTPVFDSSGADRFETIYYNPTSAQWVWTTGVASINNTQYNNVSTGTGLVDLSNTTKYGVHWVYICPEGDIYVLYGRGDYTLTQAQAATVPSAAPALPNYLTQWCLLAGKIIVNKSAATLTSISSAWTTTFAVNTPAVHNELASLDGGTTGQYFHLTSAQHTSLTAFGAETAYALLAGRAGGQILIGGTATTDTLKLRSTAGVGTTGADIIFQVGNNGATEAMRILNNGSIGIGTTAPARLFHVAGTGTVARIESTDTGNHTILELYSPNIILDNYSSFSFRSLNSVSTNFVFATVSAVFKNRTSGSEQADLMFAVANSSTALEKMRILANGRVGIGTSTPGAMLDVNGGINTNSNIYLSHDSPTIYGSAKLYIRSGVGESLFLGSNDVNSKWTLDSSYNVTQVGNLIVQGTGNSTFAGNVGIGTTAPREALDIAGNVTVAWNDTARIGMQYLTGSDYFLGMSFNSSNRTLQLDAFSFGQDSEIIFRTGTVPSPLERFRITQYGNIHIGGSAAERGTTVGTKTLNIFNGTAPAGTLTNGCSIYSTSGELYAMDAAGNSHSLTGGAHYSHHTTKSLAIGASADIVSMGGHGAILSGILNIYNSSSGKITYSQFSLSMIGGTGTSGISLISSENYSTGSSFTVQIAQVDGYATLSMTNTSGIATSVVIEFLMTYCSGTPTYL